MRGEQFIENRFGYCCYVFDKDYNILGETELHAIIYNLFVYPECRRKGKAKELLQSVIDIIRGTGYINEIRIEAFPRNNCISLEKLILFYKNMGLEVYL